MDSVPRQAIRIGVIVLVVLLTSGCVTVRNTQTRIATSADLETVVFRLFDRRIAYRNDRKACTRFRLPFRAWEIHGARIHLEAYNDDRRYARTVWFEIDGVGGYLGVDRASKGQYRGNGVVPAGQTRSFEIDLRHVPLNVKGQASARVDFARMLKQEGEHVLCTWISTYGRYGPHAWITLDLELDTSRRLRPGEHLEQVVWYAGREDEAINIEPEHHFDNPHPLNP